MDFSEELPAFLPQCLQLHRDGFRRPLDPVFEVLDGVSLVVGSNDGVSANLPCLELCQIRLIFLLGRVQVFLQLLDLGDDLHPPRLQACHRGTVALCRLALKQLPDFHKARSNLGASLDERVPIDLHLNDVVDVEARILKLFLVLFAKLVMVSREVLDVRQKPRQTAFVGRESSAFLLEYLDLLANRSERGLPLLDLGDRPLRVFVVRILDGLLFFDGLALRVRIQLPRFELQGRSVGLECGIAHLCLVADDRLVEGVQTLLHLLNRLLWSLDEIVEQFVERPPLELLLFRNTRKDHFAQLFAELRLIPRRDLVAELLNEVLRQVPHTFRFLEIVVLAERNVVTTAVRPFDRDCELLCFVAAVPESTIVQKLHLRAMGVPGEGENVRESALATAFVADNRHESRVEHHLLAVEPLLLQRRARYLRQLDAADVFRWVLINVDELWRSLTNKAPKRWLMAHMLEPLERRLRLEPRRAVVRVDAIVSNAVCVAPGKDWLRIPSEVLDELRPYVRLLRVTPSKEQVDGDRTACLEAVRPFHQDGIGIRMTLPIQFLQAIVGVVRLDNKAILLSDGPYSRLDGFASNEGRLIADLEHCRFIGPIFGLQIVDFLQLSRIETAADLDQVLPGRRLMVMAGECQVRNKMPKIIVANFVAEQNVRVQPIICRRLHAQFDPREDALLQLRRMPAQVLSEHYEPVESPVIHDAEGDDIDCIDLLDDRLTRRISLSCVHLMEALAVPVEGRGGMNVEIPLLPNGTDRAHFSTRQNNASSTNAAA